MFYAHAHPDLKKLYLMHHTVKKINRSKKYFFLQNFFKKKFINLF